MESLRNRVITFQADSMTLNHYLLRQQQHQPMAPQSQSLCLLRTRSVLQLATRESSHFMAKPITISRFIINYHRGTGIGTVLCQPFHTHRTPSPSAPQMVQAFLNSQLLVSVCPLSAEVLAQLRIRKAAMIVETNERSMCGYSGRSSAEPALGFTPWLRQAANTVKIKLEKL
ncbi:hypothetical protein ACO22_06122 [Paracoccidioides brasiliensis]|uniref:Uncharacterized protein n=1 Tax=Paracoccidioides brasiliensis TaxID=121759 RepID=A0A1D2J8H5_PARBR|nr:hypothetical protein ACO22_06122 [Paracoccidioides brasiliensis]